MKFNVKLLKCVCNFPHKPTSLTAVQKVDMPVTTVISRVSPHEISYITHVISHIAYLAKDLERRIDFVNNLTDNGLPTVLFYYFGIPAFSVTRKWHLAGNNL